MSRRVFALAVALFFCVPAWSADLVTREGKVFRGYKVTGVEPDAVRVSHDGGVERIPFESLPDAMQRQFNYDPARAEAFRRDKAQREKAVAAVAAEQWRQAQVAAERERQAKLAQADEARRAQTEAKSLAVANRVAEIKAADAIEDGAKVGGILLLIVAAVLYFVPTLIACGKGKRNAFAIFALNLLLGWTFLGWVLALIWSLTNDAPPPAPVTQQVIVMAAPTPPRGATHPAPKQGQVIASQTPKTIPGRVIEAPTVYRLPPTA